MKATVLSFATLAPLELGCGMNSYQMRKAIDSIAARVRPRAGLRILTFPEQNICGSRRSDRMIATMMRRASVCIFVLLASCAFAQVGAGTGGGIGTGVGPREIRGVPFSADVTTETTRILADGNRIHQENHGKIYRDSEGITRTEN